MTPELTPAAARALEIATRRAAAALADCVEPLHILAGLLDEDEGAAAAEAVAADLDLPAFQAARPPVPRDALAGAEGPLPPLPLHARSQAALRLARDHARETEGEAVVSGTSLLVALSAEPEVAAELTRFGLVLAQLTRRAEARRLPVLTLAEPIVGLGEPGGGLDLARILDASANRAREGLRVVEDFCRFVLDDATLSGLCKGLRHDLAGALAALPPELLIAGRQTEADVGTGIRTPREGERATPAEVARVNLKRLQEALRSLEEFGKLRSPLLGQQIEQLRYRAYTLEKALGLHGSASQALAGARLYVLLSRAGCTASLEWTIEEIAAGARAGGGGGGGSVVIQLREKGLPDRELLPLARDVRRWTARAGALFIVNDRPDLARLAGADGVHLGQDDLPVHEARRVLGENALIGVSTHDLEQVRQAVRDGASYIGVGPTFPSGTKQFDAFPGLAFVREATRETSLPAFAIGGIDAGNVDAVVRAGARRIAVGQALARADDPRQAARLLDEALAAGGPG